MTEQSTDYNVTPSPAEVEELLRSDYTKEDREGDRAGEAAQEIRIFPQELHGEIQTKALELFAEQVGSTLIASTLAKQLADFTWEAINDHFASQSAGTSQKVMEHPVKEIEATAKELTHDYLNVVIPKDWANEAIYVTLFDDGWEVCRAKDHPMGNLAKPSFTDNMVQELAGLRRIKSQLAGTLERILQYAIQLENNATASLEDAFDDDERRGVEILNRYLANQIQFWVHKHLTRKSEVVDSDIF